MKYFIILIVLVRFGSFAAAEESGPTAGQDKPVVKTKETEAKAEKPSPEGVWKAIAAVLGGVRLPDETVKAITLKVEGGKYEVTILGEKEPDQGTYTIDTSTNPKRMTITSTEGPNRGKTFLAIFEQKDADSMRVCYDLSGTEFPKEFKAAKDTQLFLVGYRRQKEQPGEKTEAK